MQVVVFGKTIDLEMKDGKFIKPPELKALEGNGSALKPAWEPVLLCRKPLSEGSVAANVLRWGTGGLAIDECRVGTEQAWRYPNGPKGNTDASTIYGGGKGLPRREQPLEGPLGRWPANVVLSHSPGCRLVGTKRVRGSNAASRGGKTFGGEEPYKFKKDEMVLGYADASGCEEVAAWECEPGCAVAMLDEQGGILKSGANKPEYKRRMTSGTAQNAYGKYKGTSEGYHISRVYPGDTGTASRFYKQCSYGEEDAQAARMFYCAKASRRERNAGCEELPEQKGFDKNTSKRIAHINHETGETTYSDYAPSAYRNHHPTVKPLALMEYLVKLVSREGAIVLDPFLGSGTTALAAKRLGRHFVGVELSEEYCAIARKRIGAVLL